MRTILFCFIMLMVSWASAQEPFIPEWEPIATLQTEDGKITTLDEYERGERTYLRVDSTLHIEILVTSTYECSNLDGVLREVSVNGIDEDSSEIWSLLFLYHEDYILMSKWRCYPSPVDSFSTEYSLKWLEK